MNFPTNSYEFFLKFAIQMEPWHYARITEPHSESDEGRIEKSKMAKNAKKLLDNAQ